MQKRYFIFLMALVLIAGIVVSSFTFIGDFQPKKPYKIDETKILGEIAHVYFKVYNTSADSGLYFDTLKSYVIIINVTNLSGSTLKITQANIDDIYHVITYRHDFADNQDYLFYPNTSRLIALTDTGGLSLPSYQNFQLSQNLETTIVVSFNTVDGQGQGGFVITEWLPLTKISADEYIFSSAQMMNIYFGESPISAWPRNG